MATIPVINGLREKKQWDLIVLTKDWHPANHCSHINNNPGATIFTEHKLASGEMQMMWPAHCVQDSKGAELHPDLTTDAKDIIIYKVHTY